MNPAPGGEGTLTSPGLDEDSVQARIAAGQVNRVSTSPSRTVADILRANLLTRFNAILGSLLVVAALVGPFQDALFGVVLVTNALIGIVQEYRAKLVLDRLAVLTAPVAKVIRAGESREVSTDAVVLDDLLVVSRGDQVVVDGQVIESDGLEIDESLLTGEPEPVAKQPGDELLSGSFVLSGAGTYQATRVGDAAFAQRLQLEARRYAPTRSELQRGIDRILQLVTWAMIPAATLLVTSQLLRSGLSVREALRGSIAGVGAMVPEGLVLLTTMAFAIAALRLARRRVLVQELAAVEGLARVDVVCLDKTGTLTEPAIDVRALEPLGSHTEDSVSGALAVLAAAEPSPNRTLQAIATAFAAPPPLQIADFVPFSSARRWSAVSVAELGTWVLGGADVLLPEDADGALAARVRHHTRLGRRVLLVGRADAAPHEGQLPSPLEPAALVVLEERIRSDAAATVRYLLDQGVACKVISGDDPETVSSIAAQVGLEHGPAVDGRDLPSAGEPLAQLLEHASVFGRVVPEQKRAMVLALQKGGHVVAMTGDGVNDVAALKAADIGMAMGGGSAASRAVGQLVLLDDSFATVPDVIAEGRRVIANIERVANLFVIKTVYATLLAIVVGVAGVAFPFFPRHLTIISALTIGTPGFFLALAPSAERARPGFLGRVMSFTAPAGVLAAAATYSAYALARHLHGVSAVQARTTAVITLFLVAFWVLAFLARPHSGPKRLLLALMAAAFAVILAAPSVRHFFDLSLPGFWLAAGALAIAAAAIAVLNVALRVVSTRAADPPTVLRRGDRRAR